MVSASVPNRAARDICISRCGESPLKKPVPYKRPLAAAESGELIAVVFKFNPSAAKLPAPLDR